MPKKNATTPQVVQIHIPKINLKQFDVLVRGKQPLVMHRFGQVATTAIASKQAKEAKQAKAARDPEAEYLDAMYVMPGSKPGTKNAKYGVPGGWFKRAAVDACSHVEGITKVFARGAFHVLTEGGKNSTGGLVPLKFSEVRMRQDYVKIGMGSTDLRYRPEFSDWSCKVRIEYNASTISAEQIVNLLNIAGFCSGLGEMRPSQKCSDSYGTFEVHTTKAA
jgi:hypothetical protein